MLEPLIDKLCERLAVEIHGVELYRAVVARIDDVTMRRRLEHFMRDEMAHRDLLAGYLDRLGVGDRMTPSARLAEAEGKAFVRLVEETTTPLQAINVLLTVELTDETGWEMVVDLGRDLGDDELVRTCAGALRTEREHLRGVRGMLAALIREQVAMASSSEDGETATTAEPA